MIPDPSILTRWAESRPDRYTLSRSHTPDKARELPRPVSLAEDYLSSALAASGWALVSGRAAAPTAGGGAPAESSDVEVDAAIAELVGALPVPADATRPFLDLRAVLLGVQYRACTKYRAALAVSVRRRLPVWQPAAVEVPPPAAPAVSPREYMRGYMRRRRAGQRAAVDESARAVLGVYLNGWPSMTDEQRAAHVAALPARVSLADLHGWTEQLMAAWSRKRATAPGDWETVAVTVGAPAEFMDVSARALAAVARDVLKVRTVRGQRLFDVAGYDRTPDTESVVDAPTAAGTNSGPVSAAEAGEKLSKNESEHPATAAPTPFHQAVTDIEPTTEDQHDYRTEPGTGHTVGDETDRVRGAAAIDSGGRDQRLRTA